MINSVARLTSTIYGPMCGDFRPTPGEHFFVEGILNDKDIRHGEIDLVRLWIAFFASTFVDFACFNSTDDT